MSPVDHFLMAFFVGFFALCFCWMAVKPLFARRGYARKALDAAVRYSGTRRGREAPLAVLHDPRAASSRRRVFIDAGPLNLRRRLQLTPQEALEFADLLGKEFHRTATTGADHMVMAAAVVLVLVAGDAIVEGNFAGQSALGQQFERAIDSGVADVGVFFLYQPVELVGGEMIAGFKKAAQNGVALSSLLQTDALQVAVENVLGFADHLARDGGLIIDALLQHGEGTAGQDTIRLLENEIHFQHDNAVSRRLEYNQVSS